MSRRIQPWIEHYFAINAKNGLLGQSKCKNS